MRCVLDASAALSFVLTDEFTELSARILDYLKDEGAIVPALWSFEVTNGLVSAIRRGRLDEPGVAHAMVGLQRLPIEVAPQAPSPGELIEIARSFELSTYDAAYLWLARERGSPLATRDLKLAAAARRAGIGVLE